MACRAILEWDCPPQLERLLPLSGPTTLLRQTVCSLLPFTGMTSLGLKNPSWVRRVTLNWHDCSCRGGKNNTKKEQKTDKPTHFKASKIAALHSSKLEWLFIGQYPFTTTLQACLYDKSNCMQAANALPSFEAGQAQHNKHSGQCFASPSLHSHHLYTGYHEFLVTDPSFRTLWSKHSWRHAATVQGSKGQAWPIK